MSLPLKWLSGIMLLCLLVAAAQAVAVFRADIHYTNANTELSFWGRGDYSPNFDSQQQLEQHIQQALALRPAHPDYLVLHAKGHDWFAFWAQDANTSIAHSQQAAEQQWQALMGRPAHQQSWAAMVDYKVRLKEYDAQWRMARDTQKALDSIRE
ncbi:MAG: hypothetical protein V7744_19845 [Pseudomonadales bacterium]